jgi:hypothetical protein
MKDFYKEWARRLQLITVHKNMPVVEFTYILQTAFAQIFFHQKLAKPNCKKR